MYRNSSLRQNLLPSKKSTQARTEAILDQLTRKIPTYYTKETKTNRMRMQVVSWYQEYLDFIGDNRKASLELINADDRFSCFMFHSQSEETFFMETSFNGQTSQSQILFSSDYCRLPKEYLIALYALFRDLGMVNMLELEDQNYDMLHSMMYEDGLNSKHSELVKLIEQSEHVHYVRNDELLRSLNDKDIDTLLSLEVRGFTYNTDKNIPYLLQHEGLDAWQNQYIGIYECVFMFFDSFDNADLSSFIHSNYEFRTDRNHHIGLYGLLVCNEFDSPLMPVEEQENPFIKLHCNEEFHKQTIEYSCAIQRIHKKYF